MPSCDQIGYNNISNIVSVPSGVVRAVTAGYPFVQRTAAMTDRLEINVGASATGDGSGRDVNNLATMDYAMDSWLSLQARQTTIWIHDGPVTIDTSMNAEDARLFSALGEGPALTIASLNATQQTLTMNFPAAYELTSPVTLENLAVTLNNPITATRPLTFKNVSLTGTAAATALTVTGTTLLVENAQMKNIALAANNARVEFYNLWEHGAQPASHFYTTSLTANGSRISFDGQLKAAFYFTTATTPATPSITAYTSQINIAAPAVVSTSSTTDSIKLYGSSLAVQGSLSVQGSAVLGGLDAFAHSVIFVPAKNSLGQSGIINNSGSITMPYVIYLNGSTLGLEGKLISYVTTIAAIGLQQSQLTSVSAGAISFFASPVTTACVELIQGVPGMAPELQSNSKTVLALFPIYASAGEGTESDVVYFPQGKLGMPPLEDWQNTGDIADGTAASYFAYATGHAPIVYSSGTSFPPSSGQPLGYVDSTTLEEAVRNIVNAETITGSSINFSGTCN
jgi:hypothetical protein